MAGSAQAAPEHIELAQAAKTETAQEVFKSLTDAVGLRKLPLSNIKRDGATVSATAALRGKTVKILGFTVQGTSMTALVPPDSFSLSDVFPMPEGTPVDGVKFDDMALVYVPKGHKKTSISANAFPPDVKRAIQHVGQNVPLAEGFNLFGQADFNGVQPIRKLMSAVGQNNLKLPVSSALPAGIFGYNLKTAPQGLKGQLLQNLKLNLSLPKLHVPGMPSIVEVDNAHLSVVGHKPKDGNTKVFAGIAGDLKVKISSKQHDFKFGMFAPDPGKSFNPELSAESKDTVKIPFTHPLTLTAMQLVASKKDGRWDAVVNAFAELNKKKTEVTYRYDPKKGDSLEVHGKFTLADIAPGSASIPGLTDVEFDDIIYRKGFVEAKGKVKGIETNVVSVKIKGTRYIAVANPKTIKVSDVISAAKGTPLDAASFEHMSYVYAPKGGAVTNLKPSDFGDDVASNVTKVVSSVSLKEGLNVIGRLAIQKDSDVGKMLSAVGAYKDHLNLIGTLSPQIFQAKSTNQIKNEILDGLDFKLPLKVSGLHLPKQVQLKESQLEIKGTKDKNGNRGIETIITGELDGDIHNETIKFDYTVDLKKQAGKPAQVAISGTSEPGTKLTIPLVQSFELTDLKFDMSKKDGKWDYTVDAMSRLHGKPVETTYALYQGKEPSLVFKTKMTIAELVGQKGLPGLDDVELDTVMSRPGMWFLHGKVKGQDTYFQIQKVGSKHLIAAYLYSMPLTELIPGSGNSPLKDANFSDVVAVYNPGAAAQAYEAGLRDDAYAWITQSNKGNPVIYPGLNIYGHIDIHPSGELAALLKHVGVTELKLPLNGRFNPKAFSKNLASIKSEILANLDLNIPLPALKIPGIPKDIQFKAQRLLVKGTKKGSASGIDIDVNGKLEVKAGSENVTFDYDVDVKKASGSKAKITVSGKGEPNSKITADLIERVTITDLAFDANNNSGSWKWQVGGKTTFRSKPVDVQYQSDHTLLLSAQMTLAEVIGHKGIPVLDDIKSNWIFIRPHTIRVDMNIKDIRTDLDLWKPSGASKYYAGFAMADFSPAQLIPGAANSPLKDATFKDLVFVHSPEADTEDMRKGLPDEVGYHMQKVSGPIMFKKGLNIFGHLDIQPTGEIAKLLKDVGVTHVNLPLGGTFSPHAFAKNISGAEIKNAILDNLDIKMKLPTPHIAAMSKYLTFTDGHLELKGINKNNVREIELKVAGDVDVKVKNEEFAFSVEVDYDRAQGGGSTDLIVKGHTDKKWTHPLGISFLDLEELAVTVERKKTGTDNTYDMSMTAKSDVGSHSKLDVTIDLHEENGAVTDATFELDGPLKLSDIPDVKDIPNSSHFEIDTIKITEHGIEAKTDFGGKSDLDAYLFTGSGWNLVLRQDNFTITEIVPPLKDTPLKQVVLSEAAVVLSKDGLTGPLSSFSPIAQDALKEIYGANAARVDVDSGLSLIAAFEHKNSKGGMAGAFSRMGLSEERLILTGDIGGLFGGPAKLDVQVDLSAHGGAKGQPKWMKSKPGVEAVFSMIATETAGQFDVEFGIGVDVIADVHGTELVFDAKTALEFEDEKIDVKIVADLKDKKGWKHPFGIPGFTLYEVGFDLGLDEDGGVHLGFDGDVKISGDEYKIAADADLEPEALGAPKDIAFVASADKVDIFFIEEVAVAMIGGGFKLDIPEGIFPQFDKVKFAFATPGAQDPDLNITGEGFALKGGMTWLDHELGQMDLSISPQSGIFAEGAIDPINLGPLELKQNHFSLKVGIKDPLPSVKVNSDIKIEYLGLHEKFDIVFNKHGAKFDATAEFSKDFKMHTDFQLSGIDLSAKKPEFKNADFYMEGDLTLDIGKFIAGPATDALNDVFNGLDAGFKKAEDAVKSARNKVNGLTAKINAERAKVRKEREKAERRIHRAEDRVNSLKADIKDDWHHYHHCHGWGKWACKIKWGIRIAGLKVARGIADAALKIAEELVAHFPIDLDPRVAILIGERDTARIALDVVLKAIEGADVLDKFLKEATDAVTEEVGKSINIKKAGFAGDLTDMVKHGAPLDLTLDVEMFGATINQTIPFKVKDIGYDVEQMGMIGLHALERIVDDVLHWLPGSLRHKVHSHIANQMDAKAAEAKRELAKYGKDFAKYGAQQTALQKQMEARAQAYMQEQLSATGSPLDHDVSETFTKNYIEVGHSGLCLAESDGSVVQHPCTSDKAQRWSTKPVDGAPNTKKGAGYVQIADASGANCIVPEGTWKTAQSPFTDGSTAADFSIPVSQFQGDGKIKAGKCANLKEYYWKVLKHGDGWLQIANLATNKCLHFSDSSALPGKAEAKWEACVGAANQVYRIASNLTPVYHKKNVALRNDQLGLCVGEADAKGNVPMATCDAAALFNYMVDIRGDIKFINTRTGNCLKPNGYDLGAAMTEVPCTQLDYQWWQIDEVPGGMIIKNAQTKLCTQPPFRYGMVPPTQVNCADRHNAVFTPTNDPSTGPNWKIVSPETVPARSKRFNTGTGFQLCAFDYQGSFVPGVLINDNGKNRCTASFSTKFSGNKFSSGQFRVALPMTGVTWRKNTNRKLHSSNIPTGGFGGKDAASIYTCKTSTRSVTVHQGAATASETLPPQIGWTTDGATCHAFTYPGELPFPPAKDFDVLSRSGGPVSASNILTAPVGPGWEYIQGNANDIGAGLDGSVWMIGTSSKGLPYGYAVYHRQGYAWKEIAGSGAVRIDVDPQGNAWIVQNNGNIWKRNGSNWDRIQAPHATDIGIGADGTVWIIGNKYLGHGYQVYRRDGTAWTPIAGSGAVRIDVDSKGHAWIVQDNGDIWKWTGSQWSKIPGSGKDIAIGGSTVVYIGTDGRPYKWGGAWSLMGHGNSLKNITVNKDGNPWVTKRINGQIWTWSSE